MRRLLRQRSYRRAEQAFVAEGAKVLEAALDASAPIEGLYVAPEALDHPYASSVVRRAREAGYRVHDLQRGVIERVADAVTPQPVLGVIGLLDRPLEAVVAAMPPSGFVVVLVDVRDPGNVGAIIRSADAAGAAAVICCDGSGDCYNPKAVRASAGSLCNVPLVASGAPDLVLDRLGEAGFRRFATVMHGGSDYDTAPLGARAAIVLGNEAAGLGDALEGRLDASLTIPIEGAAESLNVAMAATVLFFEFARRKRAAGPSSTMSP